MRKDSIFHNNYFSLSLFFDQNCICVTEDSDNVLYVKSPLSITFPIISGVTVPVLHIFCTGLVKNKIC